MATKMTRSRTLVSALRPSAAVGGQGIRAFSVTAAQLVNMPKEAENLRMAPRDHIGVLKAPLVNPADKYQSKSDNMHRYGSWLMGCLPKYIQQFSVWKDELTIYISPSGVIPVLTFLKCMSIVTMLLFA
jgi:NADH dehydrogenase (ubiquinone) Fe-S protein 3